MKRREFSDKMLLPLEGTEWNWRRGTQFKENHIQV